MPAPAATAESPPIPTPAPKEKPKEEPSLTPHEKAEEMARKKAMAKIGNAAKEKSNWRKVSHARMALAAAGGLHLETPPPAPLAKEATEPPTQRNITSVVDYSKQISASDMLQQIHSGGKTCVAFAEQLFDRIDATNSETHAIVARPERQAVLDKAAAADAKVAAGEKVPAPALEPVLGTVARAAM